MAAEATGEPLNNELITEEVKSQEDEVSVVSSAFAEQLANVQTQVSVPQKEMLIRVLRYKLFLLIQLMALSHLPKTIQSTLDEITKQLQSLIPPSKLKQKSLEPEPEIKVEETIVTNEGKFF